MVARAREVTKTINKIVEEFDMPYVKEVMKISPNISDERVNIIWT